MPKRSSDQGRAFVVLGMHRSGTSASTRALQALGVEMGDELLAPIPDQNPRGFFEDEPLLELSDRVLDALDMSWDSPRLIHKDEWEIPRLNALEAIAVQSIRTRFQEVTNWGFKNPRTARLLPFWKRVFKRVGRGPAYLIVLRNPLSVAASLQLRNGIPPRRAHLLWLLHMTDAVLHTQGQRRVCLDYDGLMEAPARQLARVAEALGLPAPLDDCPDLHEFSEEFLSVDLQNSRFEESDLELQSDLSELAVTAHGLLSRWAKDDPGLSSSQLQRSFRRIYKRIQSLEPVLADLAETDRAKQRALSSLETERAVFVSLRAANAEDVRKLDQASTDRDVARERVRDLEARSRTRNEEFEQNQRVVTMLGERLESAQGELEARSRIRDEEFEQNQRVVTMLGERLESAQDELARAHANLDVYRQQLADAVETIQQVEERASAREAEAEASSERARDLDRGLVTLREEMADLVSVHQEEIETAHSEYRSQLGESDRRLMGVSERLGRLESERAQEKRLVSELRREKDARDVDVERLQELRDVEAEQARTWIRGQAILLSAGLVENIEAIEQTRQWRVTRFTQQRVSRLRGRTWIDGMAQLLLLARTLHAEAQRDPVDLRLLAMLATDVRRTFRELSRGEIFRLSRLSASARHALRLSRRPDGPFEFVRNRVGELQFLFEHLSSVPATAPSVQSTEKPRDVGSIVDIVIPVYGARKQTLRCIESVLAASCRTPHEIIVIDDASEDPKLDRRLAEWAAEGVLTLLTNDRNQGFPATANRGMALHADRDVVLLNSDTTVHGNWLDRLRRSAKADWRVATATPFSNNAEICSYPTICRASAMPSAQELAELDNRAASANRSLSVTIPTAVGFCMYICRNALREVGLFDAERFGRGYGEENDFCLRARAHGYRHVLAADVFVAHEGGVSFSDEKKELIEAGLREIAALHPGYHNEIQAFLAEDPVLWLRQRMDIAALAPSGRPGMLMVSHSKGGGTHRHVSEMAEHLEREGVTVLLLMPAAPGVVQLIRPEPCASEQTTPRGFENLEFRLPGEFDRLVDVLRESMIRHVHIHHLLGLDSSVVEIASALGCEYDATLHDYISICPRVHVMDDRGRYCGLPEPRDCNACVKRNGSEAGFEVDIEDWRKEQLAWLEGARKVFVPSKDALSRLRPLLSGIELTIRSHAEDYSDARSFAASSRKRGALRVAVIGAIGPHKGAEILHACARDAAKRKLPIEFHLIGFSDRDQDLLDTKKVVVSGPYEEDQLGGLLRRARCQVSFIPSVWPETFCYTLSAAFRWRIFPVGFDLGAVGERISSVGWGELLPLDSTAEEINDRLLSLEVRKFPEDGECQGLGTHYSDYLADYYELPLSGRTSI